MKRVFVALWLVGVCCSVEMTAQQLQRVEYRSHFEPNTDAAAESGSRDGWESFPISQETGYDPSLQPETTDGRSALVRELAPTRDGAFQLGFIRRLGLVSGDQGRLSFRIRAPYLAGSTLVHVSVFRGANEERHEVALAASGWETMAVALRSSTVPMTAVAIAVAFPHAVTTRPERVLLSDLRLEAMGVRRLDILAPEALWDGTRGLYYLQRAVEPGNELVVRSAVAAHWQLDAPDGTMVADGSTATIRYRLGANAMSGVWTLRLTTSTAVATALLLVRPAEPVGLIFDHAPDIPPALLDSIRARKAELEKTASAELGNNIAVMDAHYLLPGLPSYFAILLQPTELAMLTAMEYRATEDPRALAQSRALLVGIAHWPMWVHPWFPAHGYHSYYPVGLAAKYVVMAEELLGHDLPPGERAALDHSLMELCAKPVYEEYVHEDRLQFNTSNWIGNTVGGALLASLVSRDPDAAGYVLGLFVKERDHVLAAYTSDGSYGEGVTYHRFDLETTELAAAAAKRVLGTSLDQSLDQGDRYMRYASYGKNGLMDFGDSHVDLTPSNVFAYIAAVDASPAMRAFYFRYRDSGTAQILPRVLWEGQIAPAGALVPEPASALFTQRGIAVLRDSWDSSAAVVAMRAGKNFNHNHADEGSVFYARGGKLWIGEAGYADYYKDPFYSTYNIQAVGHNTLLVDGNGESQTIPGNAVFGEAPSFTHHMLGEGGSLVMADLTSAYRATLRRYTRSLVHFTNGPLVVIDDVNAVAPHTLTQVWHPTQTVSAFDAATSKFQMTDGAGNVDVRAFASMPVTMARELSPLPLAGYERAEHEQIRRPEQMKVSTTRPVSHAMILAVIDPRGGRGTETSSMRWTAENGGGSLRSDHFGVRVRYRGAEDAATNSPAISAWWDTGGMMLNGTRFDDATAGVAILADHPVDLSLTRLGRGEFRLEVTAAEPTLLELQGLVPSGETSSATGCGTHAARAVCVVRGTAVLSFVHRP